MKRTILLSTLLCLLGLAKAQVQPVWTQTINNLPDSAYLFPVKILNDINGNVIALCTYSATPGGDNKVILKKYSSAGSLIWTYVFNNSSIGSPRGFDMVLDTAGNCYVAGGFMDTPFNPLLMKVNSNGTSNWVVNSTSAFVSGSLNQLFLVNNRLHAGSTNGIAVFDLNGTELWTAGLQVSRMVVDHSGQTIVSVYSGGDNIIRYDGSGNINFSDSTIEARRICVDSHNNMYLLNDNSRYMLVKYDSAGTFAWQKDSLPFSPPFGDIGFEVLTDNNDDVLLVGLNDSIYKYSPSGTLEWIRSMNGLDSYIISVKMFYDLLLIAGSVDNGGQNDIGVGLFNSFGMQNWSGTYNSNSQQEFSVDVAMDGSGIFVLEDSISSSTLVKFDSPFFGSDTANYSLVCVDSVWYDPADPNFINVSVFNGDIIHINYPTVRIISPTGDTISNRSNAGNFFAHIGNSFLTYTDSIFVQGITDFSGYTFIISENIFDTTAVIQWCTTLSIGENFPDKYQVYPNPFKNHLTINSNSRESVMIRFFDMYGKMVLSKMLLPNERTIDVSELSQGTYLLKAGDDRGRLLLKIE